MLKRHKKLILTLLLIFVFLLIFLLISRPAAKKIVNIYKSRESSRILDRKEKLITLQKNSLGYYAEYINNLPAEFKKTLLQKEDKYFYYHPGINPFSILRSLKNYFVGENNLASSTITQQLVKIIFSNETKRNLKNKFVESFYALALEANLSKEEILTMYANSIFLGNGTQGIASASRLYFGKSPEVLTEKETRQIVETISNPTDKNPFKKNLLNSENLTPEKIKKMRDDFYNYYNSPALFEVQSLNLESRPLYYLTIDQELTFRLREILKRNLQSLASKNASNGALVVIKLPENELISIIGSPDPDINAYGYKINMAVKERQIGSTIKPFIYLKGFEKNLRPYTIVEDKEYKYTIGTGFAFYPRNYDYEYRGDVTLHYALSNSLNVPAVKVLEYAGLENFYNFLINDLNFKPVQNLENYQLGIALGGLEMDLLTLSHYFTIFPSEGKLRPLKFYLSDDTKLRMGDKKISEESYIQLINKILSDRITGVEQFGQKSDLNLYAKNYAVKTGTSRDYHDSWVIGYTPDFLIGVWVGNSDDTPMDAVSGQSGAGRVWNEAMNLLLNSEYNKNTPFNFNFIKEFNTDDGIDYGLKNDKFEEYKNLLKDNSFILNPHNGDTFLLEEKTQIILKARGKAEWDINGKLFGIGEELIFKPEHSGKYKIEAKETLPSTPSKSEFIEIFIENEE